MPTTRNSMGGGASAPLGAGGSKGDRGVRLDAKRAGRVVVDDDFALARDVTPAEDRPGSERLAARAKERGSELGTVRLLDGRILGSHRHDRADRWQGRDARGDGGGIENVGTATGKLIGGRDPDFEPHSVEQVTHRDDEPLREQEHVEQQRADCCDAEDAERRTCRLADQAAPGEAEGVHRRASLRPLRRSNAHDAATVAAAPSGTAMATQTAATSGVTRTKISAVS